MIVATQVSGYHRVSTRSSFGLSRVYPAPPIRVMLLSRFLSRMQQGLPPQVLAGCQQSRFSTSSWLNREFVG